MALDLAKSSTIHRKKSQTISVHPCLEILSLSFGLRVNQGDFFKVLITRDYYKTELLLLLLVVSFTGMKTTILMICSIIFKLYFTTKLLYFNESKHRYEKNEVSRGGSTVVYIFEF